jgi:hypothetical protein
MGKRKPEGDLFFFFFSFGREYVQTIVSIARSFVLYAVLKMETELMPPHIDVALVQTLAFVNNVMSIAR